MALARVGKPPEEVLASLEKMRAGDALWKHGWYLDRQGPAPSLHCTVNAVHATSMDDFLAALAAAQDEVCAANASGDRGSYGTLE